MAHRVRRARNRIIAEYGGSTVLVVSHVTPIKTVLRMALDAGQGMLYRLHLDLASLSIAEFYPDGGVVGATGQPDGVPVSGARDHWDRRAAPAGAEKHGPHTTSRPPGGTARRAPAGAGDPRPGGTAERWVIGPDGTEATLLDNLIFCVGTTEPTDARRAVRQRR